MKTINPHQDLLTLEPFRLKDLDGEEWRAEIKRLYVPRSKEFSALALARKFGLSESTIMSIVSKR